MMASGDSPSPRRYRGRVASPSSKVTLYCAACGVEMQKWACHAKRIKTPTCSRECNGKFRGAEYAKHAHKGRAAWTTTSEQSFRQKMSGPLNHAWRGGVTLRRSHGNYLGARYVRTPPDMMPMSTKIGYIMEHRMVMARHLGRMLTRTEVVHHINHNPLDNRLENLMLFATNREHKQFEARGYPSPLWQP